MRWGTEGLGGLLAHDGVACGRGACARRSASAVRAGVLACERGARRAVPAGGLAMLRCKPRGCRCASHAAVACQPRHETPRRVACGHRVRSPFS